MVTQGIGEGVPPPRPILKYCGLIFIALLSVTIVSALAGLRFGFMFAIGLAHNFDFDEPQQDLFAYYKLYAEIYISNDQGNEKKQVALRYCT